MNPKVEHQMKRLQLPAKVDVTEMPTRSRCTHQQRMSHELFPQITQRTLLRYLLLLVHLAVGHLLVLELYPSDRPVGIIFEGLTVLGNAVRFSEPTVVTTSGGARWLSAEVLKPTARVSF